MLRFFPFLLIAHLTNPSKYICIFRGLTSNSLLPQDLKIVNLITCLRSRLNTLYPETQFLHVIVICILQGDVESTYLPTPA